MEDFVKKRLHSLTFLATLGALLGLVCWGGLLNAQQSPDAQQPSQTAPPPTDSQPPTAQQPETPAQSSPDQSAPTQTPDQTAPQTSQPNSGSSNGATTGGSANTQSGSSSDNAAGTQTFTGTIVKQGDKYVFQDAASGTTYDIDHQDEVRKFEGKRVRVHGTLDASAKMIHVQ
jgi:uncharacterized protein YdeI (BOF family)